MQLKNGIFRVDSYHPKSIMDTTEQILLITIFNIIFTGLVGGIVVYTIQKKIDATIQKSLFEHETKFSRNYEKRVEVLETLYQKFMVFRDAQKKVGVKVHGFVRGPSEIDLELHLEPNTDLSPENYFEMEFDLSSKLGDFWHYYEINRLYLPH